VGREPSRIHTIGNSKERQGMTRRRALTVTAVEHTPFPDVRKTRGTPGPGGRNCHLEMDRFSKNHQPKKKRTTYQIGAQKRQGVSYLRFTAKTGGGAHVHLKGGEGAEKKGARQLEHWERFLEKSRSQHANDKKKGEKRSLIESRNRRSRSRFPHILDPDGMGHGL